VDESNWATLSKDDGMVACATETEADKASTTNATSVFITFPFTQRFPPKSHFNISANPNVVLE
jgi:hypothetical protein